MSPSLYTCRQLKHTCVSHFINTRPIRLIGRIKLFNTRKVSTDNIPNLPKNVLLRKGVITISHNHEPSSGITDAMSPDRVCDIVIWAEGHE